MYRSFFFPVLMGLFGVVLLLYLGFWQMQRLEWKNSILSRLSEKISAQEVELPNFLSEIEDEYLNVKVAGSITAGEIHVLTSIKNVGPGYKVIAPLVLKDNRRILVDRGFVADSAKLGVRPLGEVKILGNLLWPDETDSFTPDPDKKKNIWFARDVRLMAEALGTDPVLLVVRKSSLITGLTIQPVGINIRNDHFQYALTWFSLAFIWFWMTVYFLYRINKKQ